MTASGETGLRDEIIQDLSEGVIWFSRVWEDHVTASKALQITPDDNVICVTSSGDNVLCLLLDEPKSIVAVDISAPENAMLELKVAAIRKLGHRDFLCLLGEIPGLPSERVSLYQEIRALLPAPTQKYWDNNITLIEQKVCVCGRHDKQYCSFHANHLSKLIPDTEVDALFDAQTLEEQREIFKKFPHAELEQAVNAYWKKISKSGPEPPIWQRLQHVCQNVSTKDNFYLSLFLRGHRGYHPIEKPEFCPAYLREKEFSRLKGLVDRVTIYTGSMESYISQTNVNFSKVNLSNIFDLASQEVCDKVFSMLVDKCPDGGRFAYWNMLATRRPSDKRLQLAEESEKLYSQDRMIYYRGFYCSIVKH